MNITHSFKRSFDQLTSCSSEKRMRWAVVLHLQGINNSWYPQQVTVTHLSDYYLGLYARLNTSSATHVHNFSWVSSEYNAFCDDQIFEANRKLPAENKRLLLSFILRKTIAYSTRAKLMPPTLKTESASPHANYQTNGVHSVQANSVVSCISSHCLRTHKKSTALELNMMHFRWLACAKVQGNILMNLGEQKKTDTFKRAKEL